MKKKAKTMGNERFTPFCTTRSLKRTSDESWKALRQMAKVSSMVDDLDFLARLFRDQWLKSSDNPTKLIADLRKQLKSLPRSFEEEDWDQRRISKVFRDFTCESELKAKRAVPS